MTFELTDSLTAQILFAMENQNQTSALDAASLCIVDCAQVDVDEDKIYSLPEWTSADGYNLLELFTSSYRNAKVYVELKKVLAEGRGVFRNFKDIIKKYPEVEHRFNLFKNKSMTMRILDWYNALRESWGLERLNQDFEEYDDLIFEDFIFRPYSYESDNDCILHEAEHFADELKQQFSGELGMALSEIFDFQDDLKNRLAKKSAEGFVCRTSTDEFAGCILYSYAKSVAKTTAYVAALFVNQNYRGLGIADALIQQCISHLQKNGIHFFIFSNSIVPEMLEPLLSRLGFKRTGFAFTAELRQHLGVYYGF